MKANDVQAAYAAYREIVQLYPELADDARLTDAMKQVSALQQKVVKLAPQSRTAVHAERPTGLLAAMPLAVQPKIGELAAGRAKLVFVVEQGTAYGLNAATGKTMWRRFVALDSKLPAVTALPIGGPAGSDVVLCDPIHNELLRANGTTGELVWRLEVKQPIVAEPVRAGKWLLLLTNDRRLLLIDLATGDSPHYFSLPQAVRLPPVFDAAHGRVFLAADQSNLIVLDLDQCRQVLHVGHEAGKVAAPPAIVGDFLLLPVNDRPGEATIRVFSISKNKEGEPLRPMQTIRLAGNIDITPVAVGGAPRWSLRKAACWPSIEMRPARNCLFMLLLPSRRPQGKNRCITPFPAAARSGWPTGTWHAMQSALPSTASCRSPSATWE